jgi:BirA family transcriptional regulator, biotin operon repressor / biotin---[acetyl-CoA-carboxylase] ligase
MSDFPGYRALDLPNPFGAPVLGVAETSSTMEDARRLAASGIASGAAVVADFQTAGRGRFRDRSWSGERGGDLLFTFMAALSPAEAAAFPLRAGLSVCRAAEALGRRLGSDAVFEVKWPNDVIAGGKKVCGILCESSGGWYYAGIGVNCVAREFPPGLRHPAASLEEVFGKRAERFELLELILAELQRSFAEADWIPRLEARLYRRGMAVRFLEGLPEASRNREGILRGLGGGGELLIEIPGRGIPAFVSGELLEESAGGRKGS